jgi:hypothetical protein
VQKTELSFIIQRHINGRWANHIAIRTGIRQHNYNTAYNIAQKHLKAIESTGVQVRLITKYLPILIPNSTKQLTLL